MISKSIVEQMEKSSWIRKMFEEGSRLKKIHGEDNVYDFSLGNPDLEPPVEVAQAFREIANSSTPGIHRYMNNAGYDSTRMKIASMLSQEAKMDIGKENIVMTVGAAGALNVTLKTLLDPGDEVIILAPFFVEYITYVKNHGGVPVIVHCDKNTFMPDLKEVKSAINKKTKAIIINSPNNPTGVIYPEKLLTEMNKMLLSLDKTVYVISDEPYKEIVFEGKTTPSTMKIFDNIIVCYSWSKTLALPGDRIGYLAASPKLEDANRFMAGAVMCNRSLGFVNAPAIMQRVIEKSLGAKVDVGSYQKRCNLLYNILVESGFECVKPDGALYLFPKTPIEDDVEFAKIAAGNNILLVPGSGFGMPGFFRLAFCVDENVIKRSSGAFKNTAKQCGAV